MSYLARPIANRGVHLRITPRPSNLGETREILRLLSQFGEIDYFKNLKYDGQGLALSNVALAIYKDEEGAKNCFRGSPVRFRMGKVKAGSQAQPPVRQEAEDVQKDSRGPRSGAWGLEESASGRGFTGAPFGLEPDTPHQRRYSSTSSLPKPTPRPIRMPFDPPSPPDTVAEKAEEQDRIFEIRTSSTNRNFRDHINMGHYYGSFAIDSKMPGQEDLAKRVPVLGMSCIDWRAKERPWRFVQRESEGRDKRERLGALWEREGKHKLDIHDNSGVKDGQTGFRRMNWSDSWSEVGIS